MTFKRFEDLPVWKSAMDLAVRSGESVLWKESVDGQASFVYPGESHGF